MNDTLVQLPAGVRPVLGELTQSLEAAFGRDLVSLVVFGAVTRGEYVPDSTEVNVMAVLRQLGTAQLRLLVEPVQKARRQLLLEPTLLSLEDLRRSSDVFPLRLLEVQRKYLRLSGDDLLGSVFISNEHVRLACEQEAKSIVLRMRHLYVVRAGLRPAWLETLVDNIRPLLRILTFALELTGRGSPTRVEELFERAESEVGMEAKVLRRVLALRLSGERPDYSELEHLYEAYLDNAHRLAIYVDRLSRA